MGRGKSDGRKRRREAERAKALDPATLRRVAALNETWGAFWADELFPAICRVLNAHERLTALPTLELAESTETPRIGQVFGQMRGAVVRQRGDAVLARVSSSAPAFGVCFALSRPEGAGSQARVTLFANVMRVAAPAGVRAPAPTPLAAMVSADGVSLKRFVFGEYGGTDAQHEKILGGVADLCEHLVDELCGPDRRVTASAR